MARELEIKLDNGNVLFVDYDIHVVDSKIVHDDYEPEHTREIMYLQILSVEAFDDEANEIENTFMTDDEIEDYITNLELNK